MDDSDPSATPLDLLLNAITEGRDTDQYDFPASDHAALGDLDGLLGDSVYDFPPIEARPEPVTASLDNGISSPGSVQNGHLQQVITELVLRDAARSAGTAVKAGRSAQMSTIQVWHPTAAQKSYGKERRLIVPPPFVRTSGPVLSSITNLTLSAVPIPDQHTPTSAPHPAPSSSQTRRILSSLPSAPTLSAPLDTIPPHLGKRARGKEERRLFKEAAGRSGFALGLRMKSGEQGDRDHGMLEGGITFPALWIGGGEDKAKIKGFRLVLDVHAGSAAHPGTEEETREGQRESENAIAGPSSVGDMDMAAPEYNLDPSLSDLTSLHALSTPPPSSIPPPPQASTIGQAWTTLSSSPIAIVSKPSIKTAKSRSVSSCLSENASFALWVRINAQNVRTKYMMLDDSANGARLTSRTGRWTPFRFEMIKRAELALAARRLGLTDENEAGGEEGRVLTYGSIVRLVDVQRGTKSETVKLVKVEKNEVVLGSTPQQVSGMEGEEDEESQDDGEGKEEGQPISELQKIGMIRVDEWGNPVLENGKRSYLAAPGARIGGGELREPDETKTVWIGRAKKDTVLTDPIPTTTPIKDAVPLGPALPFTPPNRPIPETLEEAASEEINDADFVDVFGIPADRLSKRPIDDVPAEAVLNPVIAGEDTAEGERPAKRRRTKRDALAAAVVAEEDEGGDQTVCTWQTAERRTSNRESKVRKTVIKTQVEVEHVEDWMCWVIAGVAEFTHSFFDPSPLSPSSLPLSISPAPRLLLEPTFPTPSTLQLTLSSFFSSPIPTSRPAPLSVCLGPIGPLAATIWRSTWRSTSLKYPDRGDATPCLAFDGEVTSVPEYEDGDDSEQGRKRVKSTFPALVEHVIVLVELPKAEAMAGVVQQLREQLRRDAVGTETPSIDPSSHATASHAASQAHVTHTSSSSTPIDSATAAATAAHDAAAWMEAVAGYDHSDLDGNEAIRQALQSVSQAAEAEEAEAESAARDIGQNGVYLQGDGMIHPDLQIQGQENEASGLPIARPSPRDSITPKRSLATAIPVVAERNDPTPESDVMSLPLLLVRRESEMVFGLGKRVVVERPETGGDWCFRLISSLHGMQ